jgi:RNA polymerase sigma-70 factor (sigma-E family)
MSMDFDSFVTARWSSLVRTARLLGCPEHEAEDIVQSTLLKAYRHWRKVSRADRPEAYVQRILINTINDARSRSWNDELATEHIPERAYESDHAVGIAVRRALAAMPLQQRQVLVLRYFADLTEQETADMLGIPRGTVKSRTSRGLAALAPVLRSPDAR